MKESQCEFETNDLKAVRNNAEEKLVKGWLRFEEEVCSKLKNDGGAKGILLWGEGRRKGNGKRIDDRRPSALGEENQPRTVVGLQIVFRYLGSQRR